MQGGQDVDDYTDKMFCSGLSVFQMAVATAKAYANIPAWHGWSTLAAFPRS